MAVKPIPMKAPEIRALLDGRKTQKRVVLRLQPPEDYRGRVLSQASNRVLLVDDAGMHCDVDLPYAPGDLLWVRETWRLNRSTSEADDLPEGDILLRVMFADGAMIEAPAAQFYGLYDGRAGWRPSIHMPRWASRITLRVTGVRVERLNDISEADAIAEGATSRPACHGFRSTDDGWSMDWSAVGQQSRFGTGGVLTERDVSLGGARWAFASYWNDINGPDAWDANPWVVAVSFTPILANVDQVPSHQEEAHA